MVLEGVKEPLLKVVGGVAGAHGLAFTLSALEKVVEDWETRYYLANAILAGGAYLVSQKTTGDVRVLLEGVTTVTGTLLALALIYEPPKQSSGGGAKATALGIQELALRARTPARAPVSVPAYPYARIVR